MEPVNQNTPAPFKPGDIVVARHDPAAGSVVVTVAEPHPKGGWRIGYRREGGATGIYYDEEVLRVPQGWTEPPARPLGARERLELAHDGAIPKEAWAAAVEANEANRDEFMRFVRDSISWWLSIGCRVNLAVASREITRAGKILAELEDEALTARISEAK